MANDNKYSPEDVLTSIGATAEVSWAYYSSLIKCGFSETDALYLVSELIRAMFSGK